MTHKPRLELMNFNENPNIGVFCKTNENIAFIQKGLSKKTKKKIKEVLDVKIIELNIADASIIGSLLSFNSKGAVICDFADEESINTILKNDLEVYVIRDKINAAGNDILVNDKGALVHPEMKEKTIRELVLEKGLLPKKELSKILDVKKMV